MTAFALCDSVTSHSFCIQFFSFSYLSITDLPFFAAVMYLCCKRCAAQHQLSDKICGFCHFCYICHSIFEFAFDLCRSYWSYQLVFGHAFSIVTNWHMYAYAHQLTHIHTFECLQFWQIYADMGSYALKWRCR